MVPNAPHQDRPSVPLLLAALLLLSLQATPIVASRGKWRPRFPRDAYFSRAQASMCVSTPAQVRAVFENHFRQLNRCSVPGLKAERNAQTQLFFGAALIRGEAAVDAVFRDFCKPVAQGGLRGLKFYEREAFIVGNTISVRWVAYAPFLRKGYVGSDAYVTCGDKMLTIVSSFDRNELPFKKK